METRRGALEPKFLAARPTPQCQAWSPMAGTCPISPTAQACPWPAHMLGTAPSPPFLRLSPSLEGEEKHKGKESSCRGKSAGQKPGQAWGVPSTPAFPGTHGQPLLLGPAAKAVDQGRGGPVPGTGLLVLMVPLRLHGSPHHPVLQPWRPSDPHHSRSKQSCWSLITLRQSPGKGSFEPHLQSPGPSYSSLHSYTFT